MYYETTMHCRRPVSSAREAAELIHNGESRDFDAITWHAADGRELAAVADNHCNNSWGEVAVIDLTNRQQIESITFAWIGTLEEKATHLRNCETTGFRMGPCKLPLDGEGDDTPAHFTCGCCGDYFPSTLADQKKYDQDNGYGLCPRCAR